MTLLRIGVNNTTCELWIVSTFAYINIHPGICVVNLLGLAKLSETGIQTQFCKTLHYFHVITSLVWNSVFSQAPA